MPDVFSSSAAELRAMADALEARGTPPHFPQPLTEITITEAAQRLNAIGLEKWELQMELRTNRERGYTLSFSIWDGVSFDHGATIVQAVIAKEARHTPKPAPPQAAKGPEALQAAQEVIHGLTAKSAEETTGVDI